MHGVHAGGNAAVTPDSWESCFTAARIFFAFQPPNNAVLPAQCTRKPMDGRANAEGPSDSLGYDEEEDAPEADRRRQVGVRGLNTIWMVHVCVRLHVRVCACASVCACACACAGVRACVCVVRG
jgi:hypothetical protein